MDTALSIYKSLKNIKDIDQLILDGESENLHLECKSPHSPSLRGGLVVEFSRMISAFSNTDGGVIIWGVGTEKHSSSGLDVLKQIEYVGTCKRFMKILNDRAPTLTIPPIINFKNKILKRRKQDGKGVILTYIPKFSGDPIKSTKDHLFYLRSGSQDVILPYEMLKRLFLGSEAPNIVPYFDTKIVKLDEKNNSWNIPVVISNKSSAVGENIKVSLRVDNPEACESISATSSFRDESNINPGTKTYLANLNGVCHKGLNSIAGNLIIKMGGGKTPKRRLEFSIAIYAKKMIAREWKFVLTLTKSKGFRSKLVRERDI